MPDLAIPPELLEGSEAGAGDGPIVAVDGGATKTIAAAWSVRERRLGVGLSGPSNPDAVGVEAAALAVSAALRQATAAFAGQQPSVALLGLAGTETGALAGPLGSVAVRTFIVNDIVTAWAAGTSGEEGLAVISGTGSNILGVRADRRSWRAGGWGHVLGDEGSAHWIGLEGLKRCLHAYDGSGPPTSLQSAALEAFDVTSLDALVALTYQKPLTKGEIAAFARHVAAVAAGGDRVAGDIVVQAGRDLGRQAAAVLTKLELHDEPLIAQIGSTWRAGEAYEGAFLHEVHAVAPGARLSRSDVPPLEGGLLLAGRAAGAWRHPPPELKLALEQSLR